ncbi:MAG: VanZ family protein [Pseudomonadota bacterium]
MKEIHALLKPVMPVIFGCCIIFTTIMALIPVTDIPSVFNFWDKAQHSLAFITLTLTGSMAYPSKTKIVYLGLVIYGAGIEVVQYYCTTTRVGDVFDWLADCIAIALGILIYQTLQKLLIRSNFI